MPTCTFIVSPLHGTSSIPRLLSHPIITTGQRLGTHHSRAHAILHVRADALAGNSSKAPTFCLAGLLNQSFARLQSLLTFLFTSTSFDIE
jgi:hypothetical protein